MRFIDWEHAVVPAKWLKDAKSVCESLESCATEAERKAIIDKNAKLWRDPDLKGLMLELSFEKCWYCEWISAHSDDAVDHFRPKSKVNEAPEHGGYWWLAFDWKNYRYSCTYCNSKRGGKGKHDRFPLSDESARASADSRDISKERQLLLDPTCKDDPGLLWFIQDGSAVPRYAANENEMAFRRADKSLFLLNLNYSKLRRRRKDLYVRIEEKIRNGDRCVAKLTVNESDDTALEWLGTVIEELKQTMFPSSEFSAAARAFIMGFREPERHWLDSVLELQHD